MRRGQRERMGFLGVLGVLVFLALTAAPSVARYLEWRSLAAPDRDATLRESALALRVAELERTAHRLLDDLERSTGVPPDRAAWLGRAEFVSAPAEVLPFGDPSPDRRALWLIVPREAGAVASSALVEDPGAAGRTGRRPLDGAVVRGESLVGRLDGLSSRLPVARVITMRDPGFRVKFRCGNQLGILYGGFEQVIPSSGSDDSGSDDSGSVGAAADRAGRPSIALEAHHIVPLGGLPPGAPVHTAGGDGVFPPGLLIGHVAESSAGEVPRVLAAVDPRDVRAVVVLTHRLADARDTLVREERR